ncbi:ABC transporter permease [Streptomyces profundus]|uniref:ABC transporter permease n=1 Tax=Streptomyces profundus TaxID=2867410 RepID=UPI001D167110|nr:ABC transporter permease [Streptomyces sp. MA3_2.13]
MSAILRPPEAAPAPATPPASKAPPRPTGRRLGTIATTALSALGVLWAAATVTFLAQVLMPGDRATLLLNLSTGQTVERTPEELAPINERFGFDEPLPAQYLEYLRGLAGGDLGTSYQQLKPVTEVISDQLAPTLLLTCGALLVAWLLALGLILLTARRGRARSALGSGFEALAASLPHYWLGVILLVVFAVELRWFPVVGGSGPAALALPVLTLAVPLAGFLGQVTRDEFERTLDQPFVVSARARGVGDLAVRVRHVLRHSVLPALTLSGWALGALFSGAVLVERVFSRPGLGQVLLNAVNARDVPVVAGVVMVVALVYVVANLLVDLAYTLIDPRIGER